MKVTIEASSAEEFAAKRADLIKAILDLDPETVTLAKAAMKTSGTNASAALINQMPMGNRGVNTGALGVDVVFGSPGPQEAPKTSPTVRENYEDLADWGQDETEEPRREVDYKEIVEDYGKDPIRPIHSIGDENALAEGSEQARKEQKAPMLESVERMAAHRKKAAQVNPARLTDEKARIKFYVRED